MNSTKRIVPRVALLVLPAVLALSVCLLVAPAHAQRSDSEGRGRDNDSRGEPDREQMRQNWERWREMRRAQEEQGGDRGGADWGGGRGRGGFGRGRGGGFPGGEDFGGEGGEGRRFRGGGFGGREGGGRPEFGRNRSDEDEDEDGERNRRREQRRGEGREERRNESSAMDPGDYARSLLKERDKNGNGMLEGDEIGELRGPAASADADKNNVITVDELVARLSNRDGARGNQGDKASAASTAGKDKPAGGAAPGMASRVFLALAAPSGAGDKNSAPTKRTYRFTPPNERPGLPGWIKSRDRNDNGQVEMSEFGRTWSQRTVSELRRYDLNDDGIVTAKEATASGAK